MLSTQHLAKYICRRSQEWGLRLSKEKSGMLQLGKKNNAFPYSTDGVALKVVNTVLDLEYLVTEDDKHLEQIKLQLQCKT